MRTAVRSASLLAALLAQSCGGTATNSGVVLPSTTGGGRAAEPPGAVRWFVYGRDGYPSHPGRRFAVRVAGDRVTDVVPIRMGKNVRWSPSGEWLGGCGDDSSELTLTRFTDQGPGPEIRLPAPCAGWVWAPDSHHAVVFTSGETSTLVDLTASPPATYALPFHAPSPNDWSPRGDRFLVRQVVRDGAASPEQTVVIAAGHPELGPTPLKTPEGYTAGQCRWSPNGAWLACNTVVIKRGYRVGAGFSLFDLADREPRVVELANHYIREFHWLSNEWLVYQQGARLAIPAGKRVDPNLLYLGPPELVAVRPDSPSSPLRVLGGPAQLTWGAASVSPGAPAFAVQVGPMLRRNPRVPAGPRPVHDCLGLCLVRLETDGPHVAQLASGEFHSIHWSPDGRHLLFSSGRSRTPVTLWLARDAATSVPAPFKLAETPPGFQLMDAFSPASQWVSFGIGRPLPTYLVQASFGPWPAFISPDRRWPDPVPSAGPRQSDSYIPATIFLHHMPDDHALELVSDSGQHGYGVSWAPDDRALVLPIDRPDGASEMRLYFVQGTKVSGPRMLEPVAGAQVAWQPAPDGT